MIGLFLAMERERVAHQERQFAIRVQPSHSCGTLYQEMVLLQAYIYPAGNVRGWQLTGRDDGTLRIPPSETVVLLSAKQLRWILDVIEGRA